MEIRHSVYIAQRQSSGVVLKKMFFKNSQNSQQKKSFQGLFLNKFQVNTCKYFEKETLTQVFFCQFFKISLNVCFIEHLRATASDYDALF